MVYYIRKKHADYSKCDIKKEKRKIREKLKEKGMSVYYLQLNILKNIKLNEKSSIHTI